MRIIKIINNNIVSCLNENAREVVVMGKGIGFNNKVGFDIKPSSVDKIFKMESKSENEQLEDLFKSIPIERLDMCVRIIEYARKKLTKKLNENIYITLTDHINFAITRYNLGMSFENTLTTEVKIFYKKEFEIGMHALKVFKDELEINMPEDEAASIALHLVNAEYGTSVNTAIRITQSIEELLISINGFSGIELDKNSIYYDELIVHLKFLVLDSFSQSNKSECDMDFFEIVKKRYSSEFKCATEALKKLSLQCGKDINNEKIIYLALNIHRAKK